MSLKHLPRLVSVHQRCYHKSVVLHLFCEMSAPQTAPDEGPCTCTHFLFQGWVVVRLGPGAFKVKQSRHESFVFEEEVILIKKIISFMLVFHSENLRQTTTVVY